MSGKPSRVPSNPSPLPEKTREGLDGKLSALIAVIAAGLAALVWWSLPGESPGIVTIGIEAGAVPSSMNAVPAAGTKTVTRPTRATAELSILTAMKEGEVEKLVGIASIAARLEVRHCGAACDAVKKLMEDEDNVAFDVRTAEDVILPPTDTYETTALTLTPAERVGIASRKTAVVVRVEGPIGPENVVARAAYAIAGVLVETLDGMVWDETARRFQTRREILDAAITTKLGEAAFAPRHIVVQLFRQEDGTARLVSLGMQRFGAPDLSLRGANMGSGPALSHVLNAAAAQLAGGHPPTTFTVTLGDIARILGKQPQDLSTNANGARPVRLDVVRPPMDADDPDNELGELVPPGGATRDAWDAVVASLFGTPASMTTAANDKELLDIAKKARENLPGAIKRFEKGDGVFFVKGPFAVPEDFRADGGPGSEQLWVEVASCNLDQCTGTLSNEPTFATNLAPGKTTGVKLKEATDWLLQQRDGGTAGGESIKALRARSRETK